MRAIHAEKKVYLLEELRRIRVDERSFGIFFAKAQNQIVKFDDLSAAQLSILKQTALVCGADLAVPREAYEQGNRRRYPALLIANRREIDKITRQLAAQPWMAPVIRQLKAAARPAPAPRLKIGSECRRFRRTQIMGIVNITPDSFYGSSRSLDPAAALAAAQRAVEAGADYLDLGAESTRPGAEPLPAREEILRLKPVLKALAGKTKIPISVDTYKSEVAEFALDHGAQMINDISGLGMDPRIAKVVARHRASVVIMHIQGRPKDMQKAPRYDDLMAELHVYFQDRIERARNAGVDPDRIVLDPGLGFGKRLDDNFEIINRLAELTVFGRPVMVGHSRKSFIGNPFGLPPEDRLAGTLAVQSILISNGASIVRVHDVEAAKRAALIADRILR